MAVIYRLGPTDVDWPAPSTVKVMLPRPGADARIAEIIRAEQRETAADQARRDRVDRRAQVVEHLVAKGITYRNADIPRMVDHAIAVVLEHNITVRPKGFGHPRACAETRTIYVRPVTSVDSYGTLLHEVGHCASPDADARQCRSWEEFDPEHGRAYCKSPLAEVGAWRFALGEAITWTREMHDHAVGSLSTLAKRATSSELSQVALFIRESARAVVDGPVPDQDVLAATALIGKGLHVSHGALAREAAAATAPPVDTPGRVTLNGSWSASRPYSKGAAVIYRDRLWVAQVDSHGVEPGAAGAGWTEAVSRGGVQ